MPVTITSHMPAWKTELLQKRAEKLKVESVEVLYIILSFFTLQNFIFDCRVIRSSLNPILEIAMAPFKSLSLISVCLPHFVETK